MQSRIKPELREGSMVGGRRPINIVLLNGELIHAKRDTARG